VKSDNSAVGRKAIAIMVVIVVLAGLLVFAVMRAGLVPSSARTTTSTATASSTLAANGLQLGLSINATRVIMGQSLRVNVSLSNALPVVNDLAVSNDWQFHGIPVALWQACYFVLPAQIAILKGNYSLEEMPSLTNASFQYTCAEGGTVNHVVFRPNSDLANLTGYYCVGGCGNVTVGQFRLDLNFTTTGYWDLQSLSKALNPPAVAKTVGIAPSPSQTFVPGIYTVAVADEWGQFEILHFQVLATNQGQGAVMTLSGFSLCSSNCTYPTPSLSGQVKLNGQSPLKTLQLFVNGTKEGVGVYETGETNFALQYNAAFKSPEVIAGDSYVIWLLAVFRDNSTALAATTVVAP